jgi:hypothetical protein
MKTNRVWVEIALVGTAVACALALLLATLGAAAGVAVGETASGEVAAISGEVAAIEVAAPQELPVTLQIYEGMVTCSSCGAKHSAALGQSAATCTRACVHGGASFVLVEPDATYLLDGDSGVLKRLAGQRARIVGALSGKTIRISSVAAES